MTTLQCPYCSSPATLHDSAILYHGRSYGLAYICDRYPDCDAYVGVHEGTETPLGRLANAELRKWKGQAHAAFDPLWKSKLKKRRLERGETYPKSAARGSGYKWLAGQMGIDRKDCHIGMFDIEQCKLVIEICTTPYGRKVAA